MCIFSFVPYTGVNYKVILSKYRYYNFIFTFWPQRFVSCNPILSNISVSISFQQMLLHIRLWLTIYSQVNSFVLFLADLLGLYYSRNKQTVFRVLAVSLVLRAFIHTAKECLPLPFKFITDILLVLLSFSAPLCKICVVSLVKAKIMLNVKIGWTIRKF